MFIGLHAPSDAAMTTLDLMCLAVSPITCLRSPVSVALVVYVTTPPLRALPAA
jgi:hypothetical protein